MSLDYNLTEIKDRATHFPPDSKGLMNDSLHVLIFATMTVGIGYIEDEAVATEFYHRYTAWTNLNGPLFNRANPAWIEGQKNPGVEPWIPFRLTEDECKHAVGLCTNASEFGRDAFNSRLMDVFWSVRA